MTRYALVKDGAVLEYREMAEPPNVDQTLLSPNKPRLLIVESQIPQYDLTGEVLERHPDVILDDKVVEVWAVAVAPLQARKNRMRDQVNRLRDEKIVKPFPFAGKTFDYDDSSQKRITGAGALAHIAITVGGKAPDNFRWHGGDEDFVWITADNSLIRLSAVMVLGLGQAAGAWDSAHVFAAKALKNEIDDAADHATLDAIDIGAGWPE